MLALPVAGSDHAVRAVATRGLRPDHTLSTPGCGKELPFANGRRPFYASDLPICITLSWNAEECISLHEVHTAVDDRRTSKAKNRTLIWIVIEFPVTSKHDGFKRQIPLFSE